METSHAYVFIIKVYTFTFYVLRLFKKLVELLKPQIEFVYIVGEFCLLK